VCILALFLTVDEVLPPSKHRLHRRAAPKLVEMNDQWIPHSRKDYPTDTENHQRVTEFHQRLYDSHRLRGSDGTDEVAQDLFNRVRAGQGYNGFVMQMGQADVSEGMASTRRVMDSKYLVTDEHYRNILNGNLH
jgi:hypothetical protein